MLSSLYREHQAKQHLRKKLQEERRQAAVAATAAFSGAVVGRLNSRVSQAYANQKRLDVEAKRLQSNTNALLKQTKEWLNLCENFNQALKEIGDVENWAHIIEDDVQTITIALEMAYKANQETR